MDSWQGIRHYTVLDRLDELIADCPTRTFARFQDWAPTYAEIGERSSRLAGQFHALGLEPGDRIATLSPNRYELLEVLIGTAKLGAIHVPLNPFLRGEFLRHQLEDSEASAIITDELGWNALLPLLGELTSLKRVILLDRVAPKETGPTPVQVIQYDQMPSGPAPSVALTAESTMTIMYTSGTTGQPKGCILSHGYYARAGQTLTEIMQLNADDVFLTPLPLFHGGAHLNSMMAALDAGIPIVFLPGFSASNFFKTATEVGATIANGVGALATMLLASPPSEFDRAHKIRLFNLSPVNADQRMKLTQRFGIDPWSESYGQTECVYQTLGSPYGERDRDSNGKPLRDLNMALLDDNGQIVPEGEVGEICIQPRHRFAMFDGYWRRPEATLEAFKEGWYHTGDYGVLRESGSIRFVDRKKDALRVRGENVSSMELEGALARHPAVSNAAVHAVAGDMGDDEIKACLVLEPGSAVDPEGFFNWMAKNLPYFAVPRYVETVDQLPINQVGRVQKHLLRDRGLTDATWDFQSLGLRIERSARRG
ncbi:AMP-binding protein [Specibacter sp. RAF43]|uniref:AMP-binding protein n=1 Tax=Specibacter sp. RAF43 TaxID=3233057 RepID=UPI003F9B51A9